MSGRYTGSVVVATASECVSDLNSQLREPSGCYSPSFAEHAAAWESSPDVLVLDSIWPDSDLEYATQPT